MKAVEGIMLSNGVFVGYDMVSEERIVQIITNNDVVIEGIMCDISNDYIDIVSITLNESTHEAYMEFSFDDLKDIKLMQ